MSLTPKRILFIRSDRVGEFLLSLPAIKLVKENYPESKVFLLAQQSNIDLVKGLDFINCFIEYHEQEFGGIRGAFKLGKILKKEEIDCVIILNPKKEFHLSSYLAGIPLRIGYARKWGFCLNRKIADRKNLEEKHEIEYNLELVRLICKKMFIPEINFSTEEKTSLEFLKDVVEINKKYIVLHPFTSYPPKKVDDTFWMALVERIKSQKKDIVIIGSKEEEEEALLLEKKLGVKNIVGKLTLRNLATFLKYCCDIFIGLDSGPLHLADILQIPVIGVFKISNPKRWRPYFAKHLVIDLQREEYFLSHIDKIISFMREDLLL